MSKWIPIDEQLPEPDVFVLVWDAGMWEIDAYSEPFIDMTNQEIEYWMPLPEPPENENGDN